MEGLNQAMRAVARAKVLCDPATWMTVLVAIFLAVPHPSLRSTPAAYLFCDVVGLGVVWVCLTTVSGGRPYSGVLRVLAIVVVALVLRFSADGVDLLISVLSESPRTAIPFLMAVVVVACVELIFGPRRRPSKEIASPVGRHRQSAEDLRRVAIHEAGHAVMYGLLPQRPQQMHAFIRAVIDPAAGAPEGGGVRLAPMQVPETYTYALMLIKLAGLEAELAVLGSRGNGGADDYADWIDLATRYAVAGSAGAFYRSPVAFGQRKINRDTLDALRDRQRAELRDFFALNRLLLLELSEDLLVHGELGHEEIITYLDRVDVGPLGCLIPGALDAHEH
jgi:hypothetical protein